MFLKQLLNTVQKARSDMNNNMNNNNNNNNNNFPSPQGDYLVLYIENVINTAILLRKRSQRVNPSRDWSPRLIPSCKLYRGPVPATGPCDQSLRLVPSCVATFKTRGHNTLRRRFLAMFMTLCKHSINITMRTLFFKSTLCKCFMQFLLRSAKLARPKRTLE